KSMFAFIENAETSRCDSSLQALSWMGKTPDRLPDNGSWKLTEASYYHHGWLATGNAKGIIGITFTSIHSYVLDQPIRTTFYLRGHRSEVMLVKWNEPFQKLATCDVSGIIFVWIKHDGRWSIELINDRNSQVTDFTWSHDGQMALICYKDSFVLVGSVGGQRYWSTVLNLEGCSVSCGIWTPDDQKVMFGTTAGKVIVMSATGTIIAEVVIRADLEITHLGWSTEKFYMFENNYKTDSSNNSNYNNENISVNNGNDSNNIYTIDENFPYILSVVLSVGDILLMTGYDDLCPKVIHTGLKGVKVEWSNDGEVLAVVGHTKAPDKSDEVVNELRFYKQSMKCQLSMILPAVQQIVTAITWAHNDQRLFVAIGNELFTIWVYKHVANLQLLCKTKIRQMVSDESLVQTLPLPYKILSNVFDMYSSTIKGYIPRPGNLREFVCTCPHFRDRLHCTIIRNGDESTGIYYVLYLEHLGGLIPLLKGKRASKLHPDFVIFDPQAEANINGKSNGNSKGENLFQVNSNFYLFLYLFFAFLCEL
ncbi:hypothetical protein HELRODRAFT_86986, partial [Helobdella robusta]|uniref:SOCS box domain-containing protein n=1 Tax=Helobdella robusta TaxID=6412 RepID=T1G6K3_HELRO